MATLTPGGRAGAAAGTAGTGAGAGVGGAPAGRMPRVVPEMVPVGCRALMIWLAFGLVCACALAVRPTTAATNAMGNFAMAHFLILRLISGRTAANE